MSLPDNDRLANDRQLALYHIGLMQNYRDAEKVRLVWHYLTFDKEFTMERTEEELEEIEAKTVELIKAIESDVEYKPRENNLCGYCDYPEYCPAKKHIIKTEALPVDEFLNDDGVALANQYVELKMHTKVLNAQIDELKARIIAYAQKEGVTSVRGSDKILRVTEKNTLKFPSASKPERKKLEALINEAGKWTDVSILSADKLEKIIMDSLWDKNLIKKIAVFAEPDKEITVRQSNLKEED